MDFPLNCDRDYVILFGSSLRIDSSYLWAGRASGDVFSFFTDEFGNVIEDEGKRYECPGDQGSAYLEVGSDVKVLTASNGGYIMATRTNQLGTAGGYDFLVIKTDEDLVAEWAKIYGGTGNDYSWCFRNTTDGGYVIAGSTDSFGASSSALLVIKLDVNGGLEWARRYDADNYDAYRKAWIKQTQDGGYIITADTKSYGPISKEYNILVMKTK